MRILMIEDEKYLAEAIQYILKRNNYIVDLVFDGENGLDNSLTDIYDLIILDIMLPKIDGITILKEIRKNKIKAPVIMLTAKGEINDKILGLDSGADDYLTKPFETEELLARIRALARRNSEFNQHNILEYNDIKLNSETLTVSCKEKNIKLTIKESQILEILMKQQEKVVSKENIILKVWGYEGEVEDNQVEVYISLIRKKLKNLQANCIIETQRTKGYILLKNRRKNV